MPCNCDGYSVPREMDPAEAWISLSRHHIALEKETENLRIIVAKYEKQVKKIKELFPDIDIKIFPAPVATSEWRGRTYRDKNGKFPNDISAHLDWLSREDYQK